MKKASKPEMRIEYMPLSELVRWPRNPKEHDDELIQASIDRFGFNDPFAIDETSGHLVEGHGRLDVLEAKRTAGDKPPKRILIAEDGSWLVPVVRGVSFESVAELEAYVIGHNRSTEAGGWRDDVLAEIFQDVGNESELLGTGYSLDEAFEIVAMAQDDGEGVATKRGPSVGEFYETYEAGVVKRIVLYFEADDYDTFVERIEAFMKKNEIDSHTSAVLTLLDRAEAE